MVLEERNVEVKGLSQDKTNSNASVYVANPGPDDILLGRGAPFLSYEGNKRFRAIVKTRRAKYKQALKNQIKNAIAYEVHNLITENGGRFLMQVQEQGDRTSGLEAETPRVWKVAPKKISLEKCKQALRDKDPQARRKNKHLGAMALNTKVSSALPRDASAANTGKLHDLANAATMQNLFEKSLLSREESSLTSTSNSNSSVDSGTHYHSQLLHSPPQSPYLQSQTPPADHLLLLALSLANSHQQNNNTYQSSPHVPSPQVLLAALEQLQHQQMQANQLQLIRKLLHQDCWPEQDQGISSVLRLVHGAGSNPRPSDANTSTIMSLLASMSK